MKCKIYTLKDLIETGLPIFDSCRSPDTKIGERFLSEDVISMWDWKDYSDYYTYFSKAGNSTIHHVVYIGKKVSETLTKTEKLKKDFSNIKTALT